MVYMISGDGGSSVALSVPFHTAASVAMPLFAQRYCRMDFVALYLRCRAVVDRCAMLLRMANVVATFS